MTLQYLLSLPAAMAADAALRNKLAPPEWVIRSDPPGGFLGSGGGTASLLAEAWRLSGTPSFADWLDGGRKMVVHGGGQSRRLPAYGPVGKPFLPLPVLRGELGQRLDQTLLDFQRPVLESVFSSAPVGYVAAVASGDVLLRFRPPLSLPEADVLALGMPATPEMAQAFGVFFFRRDQPQTLAFFLQKPTADTIRQLSEEYFFLVDTGFWLLSKRAVAVLMSRCGWRADAQKFENGLPDPYELYARFGPALGAAPSEPDPEIGALMTSVPALADSEFYHLGTSRQMIESVSRLQNRRSEQAGWGETRPHPGQFVLNSVFDPPIRRAANHTLWIENSRVPASWELASEHVLTGVPENAWALTLEPRVCIDFVPIGAEDFCIRIYGMDDAFRGRLADPKTLWLGESAGEWAVKRGVVWDSPETDIYEAALFPALPLSVITSEFLTWLFARAPEPSDLNAALWQRSVRLSAQQLNFLANTRRMKAQREEITRTVLPLMRRRPGRSAFYDLDLAATAKLITEIGVPPADDPEEIKTAPPLVQMQDAMLRAEVLRSTRPADAARAEGEAFEWLRQSLLGQGALEVTPVRNVLEDQILWGRSPLRFDLAGGWTDTPPYCLKHGGQVLNVAVNLNGQPPVQVFARPSPVPEIVLRSIDMGLERRICTYQELETFAHPHSEFALAKAALSLSGFLPRFHQSSGEKTLKETLVASGGGIELSLLAAVPHGSGLGTSSILSATLLGTLSEFYGFGWDCQALVTRTLLLEQLVTTGGGWQDQAGGLYSGIKLFETLPGLGQRLSVRWAPDSLFAPSSAGGAMLLYYTGITRLAKNILSDIVRGMFLGDAKVMACLRDIGANALKTYDALGKGSYSALCERVGESWALNQALDAGTNPPEVQAIFEKIAPFLAAGKLTGAGGGGYLFLMAHDEAAAKRIRERLTTEPPNPRARFVEFSLSDTGMQITRS